MPMSNDHSPRDVLNFPSEPPEAVVTPTNDASNMTEVVLMDCGNTNSDVLDTIVAFLGCRKLTAHEEKLPTALSSSAAQNNMASRKHVISPTSSESNPTFAVMGSNSTVMKSFYSNVTGIRDSYVLFVCSYPS